MKQVLIIVESPFLREYLSQKLEDNGVAVSTAISILDATSKMRNVVPDLIILDHLQNHQDFMKLLKQKKLDVNTANTPVIIFAKTLEQKQLLELVPFNVKKVFNKPIRMDTLFLTFSELLEIPFTIDESPGIIEVHVNENVLFIEAAQGLNIEKLNILRFKISEIMDIHKIRSPKVIIMLSDINADAGSVPLLQKLLLTVLETARAKPGNVTVLTKDDYVLQYICEQKKYKNIKVTSNLQYAMDSIWGGNAGRDEEESEERAERLGDMILKAKTSTYEEAMFLKFEAEERKVSLEAITDSLQNIRIAVIDDDFVIQELIKNTFKETNAFVYAFYDGEEFLEVVDDHDFDLAFLDINMPRVDGIGVLKALQGRTISYPIIVLSAVSQRETMIKTIQFGIKSYLIKPLKPEDVFLKSIEILKANF
jgi:DNA-binding response OmpR family regulator